MQRILSKLTTFGFTVETVDNFRNFQMKYARNNILTAHTALR